MKASETDKTFPFSLWLYQVIFLLFSCSITLWEVLWLCTSQTRPLLCFTHHQTFSPNAYPRLHLCFLLKGLAIMLSPVSPVPLTSQNTPVLWTAVIQSSLADILPPGWSQVRGHHYIWWPLVWWFISSEGFWDEEEGNKVGDVCVGMASKKAPRSWTSIHKEQCYSQIL